MSTNHQVYTGAEQKGATDVDTPKVVDHKVRSLLSECTVENFDSVSDQIVVWVNKLENKKDGKTLAQITKLVFEKAIDEANQSEIPKVQDDGIMNAEGKPITGGQLFCKYLLNRCQEDFECRWLAKDIVQRIWGQKGKVAEHLP
ncbi:hypothetical protein F5141DRAFT_1212515 [Pisolithus sp. B1]|nr:hypothetical protein F5141DRAFT_1212515 [Pisolithus sp. B1]